MVTDREINDCVKIETPCQFKSSRGKQPILVEVISEGPHCVPCEYAIAAVEYVAESYEGLIEVKVLETKRRVDALRYLDLTRLHGGRLPVPAILLEGRLVFDTIPGPDELRSAIDRALREREQDL